MRVTVLGRSGLTKAYTSVLSATGSLEISGASRWDDMCFYLLTKRTSVTNKVCRRSMGNLQKSLHKVSIMESVFLCADQQDKLCLGWIDRVNHQWTSACGNGNR